MFQQTENHPLRNKQSFLLLFIFFTSFFASAQKGIPSVVNIPKKEYAATGQNRCITIDDNNFVYAGNTMGMLVFNGSYWQLCRLPQAQPVRSLMAEGKRIYTGSFEEFGFFERDDAGSFIYTSLRNGVRLNNEHITCIERFEEKICFFSPTSLFIYDGKDLTSRNFSSGFNFLGIIDNKMHLFVQHKGIGIWDDGQFNTVIPESALGGDEAVTMLYYDDSEYLIPTREGGIYHYDGRRCIRWNSEINTYLLQKTVNDALVTNEGLYVLGTNNNGLCAFDKTGSLQWEVTTANDLQNSTVYSIGLDKGGNIWAALDNGISYINNNSDIHFIKPFRRNIGTVSSALFHGNYLYVATNQGLFVNDYRKDETAVALIKGLSGETYDLKVFDNQLICCHRNGTYRIEGTNAIQLSNIKEANIIRKTIIHQQEVLVQTAQGHLNIYKKTIGGEWRIHHTISDFLYPVKNMETDAHGNIWVSHFYKGIFRIKLNYDLTDTERVDNYPLRNSEGEEIRAVNLFKIKGRVVYGDGNTYYTHDDINNAIVPYQSLSNAFHAIPDISKVLSIDDDIHWCIAGKGFFKVYFADDEFEIKRYIPFSFFNNELPDYDKNIVSSSDKILFCLDNGVAFIDNSLMKHIESYAPVISVESVEAYSDSDTILLPLHSTKKNIIAVSNNNLTFRVAYNYFSPGAVQFRYRLGGLENDFSTPTDVPYKEYSRLHAGKYTFYAAVYDNLGNELSATSYIFEIEPPFYASGYAVVAYLLAFLLLGLVIYFMMKKIIARNDKKIRHEQETLWKKENEQKEKEIIQLRNENLQTELSFKSKELANSAFMLINKNNILVEIKEELTSQKEKLGTQYPHKYYSKLLSLIDSGIAVEDNWTLFQDNFDRIHENFFRNLKNNYPELTSNDLKICALLRLNLSTKDIANFLGNTIRGVDSARYRLRKKLDIGSDVDIVEFLIQYKGEE